MQDQAIQMELRTKGFLGAISEGTEEVGLAMPGTEIGLN